jgi:hypothetical protein
MLYTSPSKTNSVYLSLEGSIQLLLFFIPGLRPTLHLKWEAEEKNLSRAMAYPWEGSLSTWQPLDVVWSEKGLQSGLFKFLI